MRGRAKAQSPFFYIKSRVSDTEFMRHRKGVIALSVYTLCTEKIYVRSASCYPIPQTGGFSDRIALRLGLGFNGL